MTSKEKIEKAWELVNSKHIETNEEIQLVRYAVRTARDLVGRDTPEKMEYDGYENPCCPICNSYASGEIRPNYCWNCGIKFVWTSVSEKENVKFIRKIKGIREWKQMND